MSQKTTTGYKSDVLGLGSVKLGALGVGPMEPRTNSTGSVGLNHSGKVAIDVAGERKQFQVSLNITLAHSKPEDPKRIPQADIDAFLALPPQDLKGLRLENALADARVFNSGKVGFYFNGKATLAGKPCQVGCSITAIGSDTWDDDRPAERPAAK